MTSSIEELARRKFYEKQGLSPEAAVPPGRLTWEECVEWADESHPCHDFVYKAMREEAMDAAEAECN